MGSNGSFARGDANTEEGRKYKTIASIGDNIKVLQAKNPKLGTKSPEESHTPNRVYVIFHPDGSGIKNISKYGEDGKKLYEIHTQDHKGLGVHVHYWEDGAPKGEPTNHLTKEMTELYEKVINFKF